MTRGQELVLAALRKELARMEKAAERARREADEAGGITDELQAIHQEFADIVASGEHGAAVLKRLEELKKRRARAHRILKKDLVALLNKQVAAEFDRAQLAQEISRLELVESMAKRGRGKQ